MQRALLICTEQSCLPCEKGGNQQEQERSKLSELHLC